MRTAAPVISSDPDRANAASTPMAAASWVEVLRASQPVRPGDRPAISASARQGRQVAEDQALAAGGDDQRMQVLPEFRGLFLQAAAQGADARIDDVDEIVGQEAPLDPALVP